MVYFSLALPAKVNRWTNIIVATLYIVVAIGETWAFIYIGSIVEIVLLSLIVWYAWKWPKQEA